MLIVEKRYLTMEDLHALCVEHGWFTLGSVEESKKLLWLVNNRNGSSRNISTDRLYHIFMLVSIVWVAIQAWEKLKEKKK
mgnify:CR=1 FL=1